MTALRRFTGVTALVTGAGQGIGRACAVRLAAEAGRLVVSDLDPDLARSVADDLPESLALAMDVTDRVSVDDAISRAAEEMGGVDVVVNVAGGDLRTASSRRRATRSGRPAGPQPDRRGAGVSGRDPVVAPQLTKSSIVTVSSINGQTALGSEPS